MFACVCVCDWLSCCFEYCLCLCVLLVEFVKISTFVHASGFVVWFKCVSIRATVLVNTNSKVDVFLPSSGVYMML